MKTVATIKSTTKYSEASIDAKINYKGEFQQFNSWMTLMEQIRKPFNNYVSSYSQYAVDSQSEREAIASVEANFGEFEDLGDIDGYSGYNRYCLIRVNDQIFEVVEQWFYERLELAIEEQEEELCYCTTEFEERENKLLAAA